MPSKRFGSAISPAASTSAARGNPRKRWLFDYGPVVVLMAIIFVASTSAGTSSHSGWILRHMLAWLGIAPRLTPVQFETANHFARKAAHLTEYALLGGLVHRALGSPYPPAAAWPERWGPRRLLAVVAVVALYAASDEFHQIFVASRTPAMADVMLDTVGGAIGMGVKWWWERWRRRPFG